MKRAREGVLARSDEARLIEAGAGGPRPGYPPGDLTEIIDGPPALAVTALSNNQRFHPPFQ
jgi:hypothetical protein